MRLRQKITTFHFTSHFKQRLAERNLQMQDCMDVISYPTSFTPRPIQARHGGQVTEFKKTAFGKTLSVVAEIKGDVAWVITAFYDS